MGWFSSKNDDDKKKNGKDDSRSSGEKGQSILWGGRGKSPREEQRDQNPNGFKKSGKW